MKRDFQNLSDFFHGEEKKYWTKIRQSRVMRASMAWFLKKNTGYRSSFVYNTKDMEIFIETFKSKKSIDELDKILKSANGVKYEFTDFNEFKKLANEEYLSCEGHVFDKLSSFDVRVKLNTNKQTEDFQDFL